MDKFNGNFCMGRKNRVDDVIATIMTELKRAEKKHPKWPTDNFKRLAIVQEELGETFKALLHLEYEGGTSKEVHDEMVQTAAMTIRFLLNL